jgi:hypothetical protein
MGTEFGPHVSSAFYDVTGTLYVTLCYCNGLLTIQHCKLVLCIFSLFNDIKFFSAFVYQYKSCQVSIICFACQLLKVSAL